MSNVKQLRTKEDDTPEAVQSSSKVACRSNLLLDMTLSTVLSDHSVQSLLIPHQKYGLFLYRPLPEDVRKNNIYFEIDGGHKNGMKLLSYYGVKIRQADAVRALAVGGSSQWEPAATASISPAGLIGSGSAPPANATGAGTFPSKGAEETAVTVLARNAFPTANEEAVGLLRRMLALRMPPLPPDTGTLMQPNVENKYFK